MLISPRRGRRTGWKSVGVGAVEDVPRACASAWAGPTSAFEADAIELELELALATRDPFSCLSSS